MTVTASGLVTKRFPELLEQLRTNILNISGNQNIDLSETSILGILNSVYGASAAEQQQLIQAVYAAGDIDAAEGVNLDRLVAYIGLTRLAGRKSTGFLYFTVTDFPKVIPLGTRVVSVNRDVALTTNIGRITTSLCAGFVLDFTVQNSSAYTFTLNGVSYTYTSDSSATKSEIAAGIAALFPTSLVNAVIATDSRVSVFSVNATNSLQYANVTTNIQAVEVTGRVSGESEIEDSVEFPSGTINRLETPINGVSVLNRQSWAIGAARESDETLRARHALSTQIVGLKTEAAIIAKVLAVEGVEKAVIRDNVLDTTDLVTGLPPHSFEVVVKGGTDAAVAEQILYSKSAGIQTFGNISVNVSDETGVVREINFSRPVDKIIWVKVQYEIYDEEVLPPDVEDLIRQQVFNYGDALDVGQDVIANRFIPAIYTNINGLGAIVITIATTPDLVSTPTYSGATIPISDFEESIFALNRIVVEEL